jgi:hypothetical protein
MKRHKFLAPFALSIAALLASVSNNDKALIAHASPTIIPQTEQSNNLITTEDNRILHDFVLKRDENNVLMAEHWSHSSHRSHSSHSSHRSHYSGY